MINNENIKLIKNYNHLLVTRLKCEIFKLEYDYSKKELHLVQIRDTGVISKRHKRIFKEVKREVVLAHDPCDEDLYLFIFGLLTSVHVMEVHIQEEAQKTIGAKVPTIVQ